MVLANFRKTIAIDLSAMSSDLSRQDVVNILLDFFSHVTVKSIQFVPVKLAHVTFEDSATKDYYIRYDELEFNGVKCRVLGAGSRAQQVLVYHYPYEEDDESLKSVLEDFGKVLGIRHQHYVGHNAVSTGTRIVQMIRDRPIRRNLMVDGYRVKIWYVGQPLECDICSRGHISRDCPMRGKCRHCGEPGHLARACKNPPRVWDVLTQNNDESSSSSASADPTPDEAVQISSGTGSSEEPSLSCSMFSGVGADLVSGGCDWGDLPAPEEGDPFSLSASDSDSSLGSHVSPSLSKRSSTSANNDQSKRNGNSKNDSDKRKNDIDKSSSTNVSDKCSSKNDSNKRSTSSNSKNGTSNPSSTNASDKCSSKNDSDKCSNSGNSKNDTGSPSSKNVSDKCSKNDSDKRSNSSNSKKDTDKRSSNNCINNGSSVNDSDELSNSKTNNDQNDIESMDATSGAVLDSASEVTDVAMSESRLGKRVFYDVETSTDGNSTGSGATPAPKKGTGKPTSRVKKVASSESA